MSTQIIVTPGVSIVTFNNVAISHQNTFICDVFEQSAEAGINIDMISQAPAASEKISFGFTFSDNDMPKLISIINRISRTLTPMINVGNVKITIKSNEMVSNTGFASRVMGALRDLDCLPLLVTTGLDEISLLVYESECVDLEKKLKEAFA
ncbi:MAG: aspartate kinase [Oscillospiraceae bacterium]|jgi:aspartate kinase|nr:aspartate kinase [Oscillospiraceae bacterium]